MEMAPLPKVLAGNDPQIFITVGALGKNDTWYDTWHAALYLC